MSVAIAVYGASGALGQLVVRDLVRRGAWIRAGGRDAEKLDRTEALLGPTTVRVAASVDDRAALTTLFQGARVVVNTARLSPSDAGRLVDEALEAGLHYIDAAGEQAYIADLFQRRGQAAAEHGSIVVPACGFDYALGDCLAHLVAQGVQPAREVVVAYAVAGSDVSANSLQFAAETPASTELLFEHGGWRPARLEVLRRRVEFPKPFGVQVMARYAAGEVITIPRHVDTAQVTVLITASSLVPDPRLVPLFPYVRPAVAWLRRTPGRHLLGLAARLKRTAAAGAQDRPAGGGEGEKAVDAPRFAVVAEAESARGSVNRGVVQGGSYHAVTATTLGFVATQLSQRRPGGGGVLAPAEAVDPVSLLDDLRHLGVTWQRSLAS